MPNRTTPIVLSVLFACTACGPGKQDAWANIDYSKVYKAASQRSIDDTYRQPSVVGCVNDDLYMCR